MLSISPSLSRSVFLSVFRSVSFFSPLYLAHSHSERNSQTEFELFTSSFPCRRQIKECVNAGPEDVLIFTGSGATSAVHKIIHALQLNDRRKTKRTVRTSKELQERAKDWKCCDNLSIRMRSFEMAGTKRF